MCTFNVHTEAPELMARRKVPQHFGSCVGTVDSSQRINHHKTPHGFGQEPFHEHSVVTHNSP
jgi:hypothetical protein